MEKEKYDFSNSDDVNRYLDHIQEELQFEDETKKEFIFFLGRDVKDFILKGAPMDREHQIISGVAFEDAIEIICGKPAERRPNLNTPEKAIIFESIRNAFVDATNRLQEHYPKEYVGKILLAFHTLIIKGVCESENSARCLEFTARTILALQKPEEPII